MTTAASTTSSSDRPDRAAGHRGRVLPDRAAIEMRRVLRNRRTLIFTWSCRPSSSCCSACRSAGRDAGQRRPGARRTSWSAWPSTARWSPPPAAAATVATERALGWSRQLRLTPLRPAAYVATKVAHRDGPRPARGGGRVRRRGRRRGTDAGARLAAGRTRGLARLAGLRRVRPVHRLPRPGRERHAVHRPDAGHARHVRRPVRAGGDAARRAAAGREVHPGVRGGSVGPRAADR